MCKKVGLFPIRLSRHDLHMPIKHEDRASKCSKCEPASEGLPMWGGSCRGCPRESKPGRALQHLALRGVDESRRAPAVLRNLRLGLWLQGPNVGNGCTHRKRPPAALLEIARRVGPHGRIDPGAQCLIANRPQRGDVVTVRASLNQRCGPPREPLNSKRARVLRAFPAIYANDNFSHWESQFAEPASSEFSYQEKRNVRLRIRSCYGTFSR